MTTRSCAVVVAVPARDEAERIGACLQALLDQRDLRGVRLPEATVSVLVYANNCRDGTAAAARAYLPHARVIEAELPPERANAGGARRAAMDAAAAFAPPDALICTTDADSRARPDWIARLLRAMEHGAEAVAGAVDFDPREPLAGVIGQSRRLEDVYSSLQAEIVARTDPEAHNPWPNHIWAWGANLAVTSGAYRRVGGLPAQPLAEDRAFVERLRLHDVPVRHCLDARVWTSGRRDGRAPGGLASLVGDHLGQDLAPCDAALEPAWSAWRRAAWRVRLRQAYRKGRVPADWTQRLGVTGVVLAKALEARTFGAAWSRIEAASPRLVRPRLGLHDLAREIRRARALLARLDEDGAGDPSGSVRAAAAGLWSAQTPP